MLISNMVISCKEPHMNIHVLQMAGQLQALLAEKARLAQENDRLARENNGLQVS